jgi:hypothetical protein
MSKNFLRYLVNLLTSNNIRNVYSDSTDTRIKTIEVRGFPILFCSGEISRWLNRYPSSYSACLNGI